MNIGMVQNVLLIWLHNNIDDNSADYRNILMQLQHVVNTIMVFTDVDKCIDFLTGICNETVLMIISDALFQDIIPLIHNVTHLHTLLVHCENKEQYEQLPQNWPKVKGIFTEILPIYEVLKRDAQQCEHNAISISFMTTDSDMSRKKIDELDCSFMWTQILKEILLSIKFEEKHTKQFIECCGEMFADNGNELTNINKFGQKYRDQTPIWWYTCQSFLYSMLNCALRTMSVDTIIKMGFFISDLCRHIKQLHIEQFDIRYSNEIFTVYRGQGMSRADFDQMNKTKGGLLSFNNFLSTSRDYNVSHAFAESNLQNPDLMGILFVMTIDPSKSTTPFACIKGISYFKAEDEILFSMHTVFRIRDITSMDEKQRLFQVDLTLTSDDDQDLRALTDRIRADAFLEEAGWHRLGKLLLRMHQSEKAEKVYEVLLKHATEDSERGTIYHHIGWAKYGQGEYNEAIRYYEKALAIRHQSLSPNHPDLAKTYNNIVNVYRDMGEYSKALLSHEKALAIQQQSLPPKHPDVAMSYNNVGMVYENMGEYSKALSSYEKALAIWQQSHPPNHPDLGCSYSNIGSVYEKMGEYSKALSYHEKDLEISQKSLPPNHPDLAATYNNIGTLLEEMGEYLRALSFYEKALAIWQQSHPPNHPDSALSHNNIGIVYRKMNEYSKALSFLEKAVKMRQQSLPSNHPDLAVSYESIGNVYENIGDYLKARAFYERAVDIGQHSLPPNHPELQRWRKSIENVKTKL